MDQNSLAAFTSLSPVKPRTEIVHSRLPGWKNIVSGEHFELEREMGSPVTLFHPGIIPHPLLQVRTLIQKRMVLCYQGLLQDMLSVMSDDRSTS